MVRMNIKILPLRRNPLIIEKERRTLEPFTVGFELDPVNLPAMLLKVVVEI